MKQILFILLALLIGIPTLSAQSKKEQKKAKAELVRKIITSRDYTIGLNDEVRGNHNTIDLDGEPFRIEIKNDSVFSDIVYLGKSDVPEYYKGGKHSYNTALSTSRFRGLELYFLAPLEEYTLDINKKGNAYIKFSVRNAGEVCTFKINVQADGSANVYVTMLRHGSARFLGKLEMPSE